MQDPNNYYGGQEAVEKYLDALKKRQKTYPFSANPSDITEQLSNQGYAICHQAIDTNLINQLRNNFDTLLRKNKNLKSRGKYDAAVNEPLHSVPLCFDIACADLLIDIATTYLECKPAIGTTNLRKSYVNNLPEANTLLFHSDRNSIKFLKFFFYLHDVNTDGGPFTYVEGSHHQKFRKWDKKYRWSYKEMKKKYNENQIKFLTANAGDMIVADPTGFHRGTKLVKHNRMMLTVNYVIHPEYWKKPTSLVKQNKYDSMPTDKRFLADFLVP